MSSSLTWADSVAPPVSRCRKLEASWGRRSECVDERSSEGIAHDQERRRPLPLDGGEHVVGIEPGRLVLDDHRASARPGRQRVPVGGAVHERRSGQGTQARAGGTRHELLGGLRDAEAGGQEVGLAPEHALGHAGGAARVEDVEVVRAEVGRCRRARPLASAAS